MEKGKHKLFPRFSNSPPSTACCLSGRIILVYTLASIHSLSQKLTWTNGERVNLMMLLFLQILIRYYLRGCLLCSLALSRTTDYACVLPVRKTGRKCVWYTIWLADEAAPASHSAASHLMCSPLPTGRTDDTTSVVRLYNLYAFHLQSRECSRTHFICLKCIWVTRCGVQTIAWK